MLNCSGKFLLAYNILLFTVTHYQIINGLERVVEGSTEANHIHVVAIAFKVGGRFSNNV
ncbi:unnamed protein product [Brassica rapa subsp. trilocularis]